MTKRVLILCTGNSCRSQMAQYLWQELGQPDWECHSAGSHPTGYVHPLALRALEEAGIAAPGARSKSVDEFVDQPFDLVVTVCGEAQEACPTFPGARDTQHWPFPDPAGAAGSEAEVEAFFREVRDAIRSRIASYLEATA